MSHQGRELTGVPLKSLISALLLDITSPPPPPPPHQKIESPIPPLITDHILESLIALISLIAFRQILPKKLPACAFSVTQSWLIWKSSLELNLLIPNSVQQDHFLELYPVYLSSYKKCSFLWCCCVAPTRCGLSSLFLNFYENPWRWEKNPTQQPKISSFLPPEKSPLINLHPSLLTVSLLPHQISVFM